MSWAHLVHECRLPAGGDAGVGSIWVCDREGCRRRWEIVGFTTDDRWDWLQLGLDL